MKKSSKLSQLIAGTFIVAFLVGAGSYKVTFGTRDIRVETVSRKYKTQVCVKYPTYESYKTVFNGIQQDMPRKYVFIVLKVTPLVASYEEIKYQNEDYDSIKLYPKYLVESRGLFASDTLVNQSYLEDLEVVDCSLFGKIIPRKANADWGDVE